MLKVPFKFVTFLTSHRAMLTWLNIVALENALAILVTLLVFQNKGWLKLGHKAKTELIDVTDDVFHDPTPGSLKFVQPLNVLPKFVTALMFHEPIEGTVVRAAQVLKACPMSIVPDVLSTSVAVMVRLEHPKK